MRSPCLNHLRPWPSLPSSQSACLLAAVLIIAAILPAVHAGEPAADGWQFAVIPFIWMPGLNGEIGIRGVTAAVDASFIDILDTLKEADSFLGLLGGFEARHGRWGGFFYGMWTKLSADAIPAGPITLQVETEVALAEFAALYRLGEWTLGRGISDSMAEGEPRLAIELYAGGRLSYVQAEIGVNRPPPENRAGDGALSQTGASGSHEDFSRWQVWVDPMLGSRFTVDLYKRFQLLAAGDIGGFGVGAHFAASAMGLLGYRFQMFGRDAIAHGGYRAFWQNYQTRTDGDLFTWDVTLHAPILGLTIRF
jgi:hypothetical protein